MVEVIEPSLRLCLVADAVAVEANWDEPLGTSFWRIEKKPDLM